MIDSIGGLCLMGGLALSGYMHPSLAIGLLLAFLLLSIQSYLATYTMGEFQLSFWNIGPTELRVLLAIGNVALLFRPVIFHGQYRLFDVGGVHAFGFSFRGTSGTLIQRDAHGKTVSRLDLAPR